MRSGRLCTTVLLVALVSGCGSEKEPAPAPTAAELSLDRGACVVESGDTWREIGCADPAAYAKVLAAVWAPNSGARPGAVPDCPDGTDQALEANDFTAGGQKASFTDVCIRNLKPPNPSDPGRGGGLGIVVGDCVWVRGEDSFGEARCAGGDGTPPTHVVKKITPGSCPGGYDAQAIRIPDGDLAEATAYCLSKV